MKIHNKVMKLFLEDNNKEICEYIKILIFENVQFQILVICKTYIGNKQLCN